MEEEEHDSGSISPEVSLNLTEEDDLVLGGNPNSNNDEYLNNFEESQPLEITVPDIAERNKQLVSELKKMMIQNNGDRFINIYQALVQHLNKDVETLTKNVVAENEKLLREQVEKRIVNPRLKVLDVRRKRAQKLSKELTTRLKDLSLLMLKTKSKFFQRKNASGANEQEMSMLQQLIDSMENLEKRVEKEEEEAEKEKIDLYQSLLQTITLKLDVRFNSALPNMNDMMDAITPPMPELAEKGVPEECDINSYVNEQTIGIPDFDAMQNLVVPIPQNLPSSSHSNEIAIGTDEDDAERLLDDEEYTAKKLKDKENQTQNNNNKKFLAVSPINNNDTSCNISTDASPDEYRYTADTKLKKKEEIIEVDFEFEPSEEEAEISIDTDSSYDSFLENNTNNNFKSKKSPKTPKIGNKHHEKEDEIDEDPKNERKQTSKTSEEKEIQAEQEEKNKNSHPQKSTSSRNSSKSKTKENFSFPPLIIEKPGPESQPAAERIVEVEKIVEIEKIVERIVEVEKKDKNSDTGSQKSKNSKDTNIYFSPIFEKHNIVKDTSPASLAKKIANKKLQKQAEQKADQKKYKFFNNKKPSSKEDILPPRKSTSSPMDFSAFAQKAQQNQVGGKTVSNPNHSSPLRRSKESLEKQKLSRTSPNNMVAGHYNPNYSNYNQQQANQMQMQMPRIANPQKMGVVTVGNFQNYQQQMNMNPNYDYGAQMQGMQLQQQMQIPMQMQQQMPMPMQMQQNYANYGQNQNFIPPPQRKRESPLISKNEQKECLIQ